MLHLNVWGIAQGTEKMWSLVVDDASTQAYYSAIWTFGGSKDRFNFVTKGLSDNLNVT